MIKLNRLRKSYQTDYTNLEVLKGIDLEIEQGEFVSIMGSSGSGKISSILKIRNYEQILSKLWDATEKGPSTRRYK